MSEDRAEYKTAGGKPGGRRVVGLALVSFTMDVPAAATEEAGQQAAFKAVEEWNGDRTPAGIKVHGAGIDTLVVFPGRTTDEKILEAVGELALPGSD